MARIIKANGEVIQIKPEKEGKLSLKQMQSAAGGYIEHVIADSGEHMFVNVKSNLADIIVGDVIVCNGEEVE